MTSGSCIERKRNCLDRISTLPDEVISKILIHLPIREAVATSRLSRNWRYKWRFIPELVFDEHSTPQSFDQWVNFIDNVLLLHDGDIIRFKIQYFLDSASSNVDQWLQLLSRKKLSKLSISFQWRTSYVCPTSLFNFQDLKILALENCRLQLPPHIQFNGFKKLHSLRLIRVTVNKETIEFLVNNCPLLRTLGIKGSKSELNLSHLSINAPNLRTCVINGECEGVTLFETPKLVSLHLRSMAHRKVARCKLDGILGRLVKLQNATIYHPFVEVLSIDNFGKGSSTIYYRRLTYLSLYIDFEDLKQILAALWIFRSSPFLKMINIGVERVGNGGYNDDTCVEEFYESLEKKSLVLRSLEIFNLEGFGGSKNEFKFIQFLLLISTVLQTMKIKRKQKDLGGLTRESALLKLEQFQRTSCGVTIELHGWEQDI